MRQYRSVLSVAFVTTFSPLALAGSVSWVDWSSSETGTVLGTVLVDETDVTVTYEGEFAFVQTECGTNYWTATTEANPYTSSTVDNPPDASGDTATMCDIIALNQATEKSLTFSEPVTNPLFAVVSLNGNGYRFNRDFEILSVEPGYWGSGTLEKEVTDQGNGSVTYDLIGTGEPHGVIQFIGTFSDVSWTSLTAEHWNGFSIAVEHLAAAVPPELGVLDPNGNDMLPGQTFYFDAENLEPGTDVTVEFTIANTGTGPLNIEGITLSGAGSEAFVLGSVVPAIAAGGSAPLAITFTAGDAAPYGATVTISNDDSDEGEFQFALSSGKAVDTDGDTIADANDNCPDVLNTDQADADNDGVGDACDAEESPANTGGASSDDGATTDNPPADTDVKGCNCRVGTSTNAREARLALLLGLGLLGSGLARRRGSEKSGN